MQLEGEGDMAHGTYLDVERTVELLTVLLMRVVGVMIKQGGVDGQECM